MAKKIWNFMVGISLLLALCGAMPKSVVHAAKAPKLQYVYTDFSQERSGDGQLVIAAFDTAGAAISASALYYQKGDEAVNFMAATEIKDGYVAFLIQHKNLQETDLKSVQISIGGETFRIDLQAFQNAQDTEVMPVLTEPEDYRDVEAAVAERAGDIAGALRAAEINSGAAVLQNGVRSNSINGAFGVLARGKGEIVVVLDAGHGGTDSGAVRTWDGVRYVEKDIDLKISKYTKEELEKYAGVKVYMTRTTDIYLTLEQRVNYAASVGATVLISQHINATPTEKTTATGAEVMVSSGNYNYDQSVETAQIARAILKELEAKGFKNRDLVYKLSESGDTYPNKKLADYYGIVRRSVLAGFPGMIVEHGFVSNPSDCVKFYGSDNKIKALGVADATALAKYYGLQRKNEVGWNQEGNNWYYQNASGERAPAGWLTLGSEKYYLNAKGYRMTGWQKIGAATYFFNSNGTMQRGLLTDAKNAYWFATTGKLKRGYFLSSDGTYRYANAKGILYRGWKNYKGSKYYFDDVTGAALIGFNRIGKDVYFFDDSGKMQTGMIKINGNKYYLAANGVRVTGWVRYNNKKYYFSRNTGAMTKASWHKSGTRWYYLSKVGPAYQNKTVKINGKNYKFNKQGICTNY